MPLSPQRIAELDAFYAQQQGGDKDFPTQLVPDQPAAPTISPERMAQLDQYYAQNKPPAPPKTLLGKMWENAKHGASDLGEFITMDYPAPGEGEYAKILKQKRVAGTADRLDYQRALLEGMYNSPGGRFLGAAGGLIPEFNVLTTTVKDYVNPAIVKHTGADESTVALTEMTLPFLATKTGRRLIANQESGRPTVPPGGSAGGPPAQLPSIRAAGTATKAITYPIRHPLNTAMSTIRGGTQAAGAVAKPVIQPIIRGILEADNPITGEPGLKTALQSPAAQEGTRLGQKMGVEFSAGELTGNPTAIGIEDALANSARWGGRFAEANQKKVNVVVDRFNKTLDKIYPESSSRTDVGERISATYNNTLSSLVKTRSEQAKIDFQAALKGAGEDGNYILSNNLFRELQAIKAEGEGKLLTKSNAHAAAVARGLLNRVSTKTKSGNVQADTISLKDMAEGLSNFSAEARARGGVLDNAQTAAERRVYARLFSALQKDLDAEIANPRGNPERAAMLQVARDNFKQFSTQISDIQKTAIGKVIGGAARDSEGNLAITPESIADRFASMQPTELRNTLKFLDKNHPEVANMGRRYVLESALRKAAEGRGLRGEGTTKEFSKAEFVKALPDRDRLNALLKDPNAYNDVLDVASAMNRLTDWGAQRSGSQTAQRQDFLGSIAKWGRGAFYRAIVSDSLAEDLMNPTTRRQIANEVRANSPKGKKP